MVAVGGTCAVIGAVAGIAGTSAAPSKPAASPVPAPFVLKRLRRLYGDAVPVPGFGRGLLGLLGAGGPVHAELVVPSSDGKTFQTVTIDDGTVQSVSGDQLTITEGTKTATYKTLTLTIPAGATVSRDQQSAQLSALQAGDTVTVVQGPSSTRVSAFSAGFAPTPTVKAQGGTLKSVSGDVLTLAAPDGSTSTVTVPSSATVTRDGQNAQLSDLKSGDRVFVLQTPRGTRVVAFAPGSGPGPGARGFALRMGGLGGPGPAGPGAAVRVPPSGPPLFGAGG